MEPKVYVNSRHPNQEGMNDLPRLYLTMEPNLFPDVRESEIRNGEKQSRVMNARFVTPSTPMEPLAFSPWVRLVHEFPVDKALRELHRSCLGDHALHYFQEGTGIYHLCGKSFEIHPGCVALVRPGEAYEFTLAPLAQVTMYNIHFDLEEVQSSYHPFPVPPEDWMHKTPLPESFPIFQQLENKLEYEQTFHRLLSAAARFGAIAELERKSEMLKLFAILLQNRRHTSKQQTQTLHHRKVEAIVDLLARQLANNIKLEELAGKLGISRALLCRVFRESTGTSIQRYFIEMKFRAAQSDLLSSRLSIKEIAAKYGFSDVHHFTRRFRQITGSSPGAIRKK